MKQFRVTVQANWVKRNEFLSRELGRLGEVVKPVPNNLL